MLYASFTENMFCLTSMIKFQDTYCPIMSLEDWPLQSASLKHSIVCYFVELNLSGILRPIDYCCLCRGLNAILISKVLITIGSLSKLFVAATSSMMQVKRLNMGLLHLVLPWHIRTLSDGFVEKTARIRANNSAVILLL